LVSALAAGLLVLAQPAPAEPTPIPPERTPESWNAPAQATCPTGTPARATPLAEAVVDEINRLRTRPAEYAQSLRTFRGFIHGGVIHEPGEPPLGATPEFIAALDEAVALFERQAPLPPLRLDPRLVQSAAVFAADQGQKGGLGHMGSDGSTVMKRVQTQCLWAGTDAEVLDYGRTSAAAAVRDLVIDWGSTARPHRTDLLDPSLQSVGAAAAPHAKMGHVIVVDLAGQELKR
jgi:uncharacterized protein YkwD